MEWVPPPRGCLKLNFDGSSKGNPGPAGFGGIITGDEGQIIMVYSGPMGTTTSNEAEVTGLLEGVKMLSTLSTSPLAIEGDSKLTIGWARKAINIPWKIKHIIDELSEITKDWNITWNSIPRSANHVADHLAKGVNRSAITIGNSIPLS